MSNAIERTEFANVSPGVVGVTLIDDEGRRKGGVVKPGETIWLSREECIATANAPRRDEDNPFAKGWLERRTVPADVENRRTFGWEGETTAASPGPSADASEKLDQGNTPVAPPREEKPAIPDEVGAPPLPVGDPATGVRSPGEEVGTPDVVPSGKRPAATRGQTVQSKNPAARPAPKPGAAASVVVGQGGPRLVEQDA